MSTKNLRYLSSEQALADLANFIEAMNVKYELNENNRWIVYGGSYAGSLAAWLRYKYPHLVHGAISSSAPVLAKADFTEYFEVVRDSIRTYDENCVKTITEVNNELKILIRDPAERKAIENLFGLCDKININNIEDVTSLFQALADNIALVVQYNNTNCDTKCHTTTINKMCDTLADPSFGTPLQRFAKVIISIVFASGRNCLKFKYSKIIDELKKLDWKSNDGDRLWTYQTCTEFGFYQTSEKETSLFGPTFDVMFFEKLCTDVFGSNFNPLQLKEGIHRTNNLYGGFHIKATRVVFVHGSTDPWHALGITESRNEQSLHAALFIPGTSHCADMCPPNTLDPPKLKVAQFKIDEMQQEWLRSS